MYPITYDFIYKITEKLKTKISPAFLKLHVAIVMFDCEIFKRFGISHMHVTTGFVRTEATTIFNFPTAQQQKRQNVALILMVSKSDSYLSKTGVIFIKNMLPWVPDTFLAQFSADDARPTADADVSEMETSGIQG